MRESVQNYYRIAHSKKVADLKQHIIPVPVDDIQNHAATNPRIVLEEVARRIAEAYGYEFKTERDVGLPDDSAGYHSHFPRVMAVRLYGIPIRKALKTTCHEMAHCTQSRAVEIENGYRHRGEVALDFVEYYIYELRADALGFEIYRILFNRKLLGDAEQRIQKRLQTPDKDSEGIEIYPGVIRESDVYAWPVLREEDFKTYAKPSGVIRLYRKWHMKFQRWIQVLDK